MNSDLISWEDISTGHTTVIVSDLGKCPICFKKFPLDEIDQHVNYCIIESEKATDPFSIIPTMEEDDNRKRKLQEEENERLLYQLLAAEENNPKPAPIAEDQFQCVICNTSTSNISTMHFTEQCSHCYCKTCITKFIVNKIDQGKCSEISCQQCQKPLVVADLKELLTKEEFEKYEKNSFDELIGKNNLFIKCPNEKCSQIIEKVVGKPDVAAGNETGPDGKPLSKLAIDHRNEHRFRCRECQVEFCSTCRESPYHLGFNCEQYKIYKSAKHCRFCNTQVKKENTLKDKNKAIENVCNSQECAEKYQTACTKNLLCGHPCGGIKGEKKCPPCLHEDCVEREGISQSGEDFCNICWVESLSSAPCVQLECGHFFHFTCTKKKIENKWATSRITFGFLECALCKKYMKNEMLKDVIDPIMSLHKEVQDKALDRFKLLGLEKSDDITKKESKWHNDSAGYSMYRFSYFPCYKCKKPYFGGEKVCDGNNNQEFDPKELVCGGCSDFAAKEDCPNHGKEYIEYKCRFCCQVAVWFCWGTTHFCEECHKKASTLPNVPHNQLPKCNCTIKHPANGAEYLLGCSLCRIQQFNCY